MKKKIFKSMVVLIISVFLIMFLIMGLLFRNFFYSTKETEVRNEAEIVATALGDLNQSEYKTYLDTVASITNMEITLFDETGNVQYYRGSKTDKTPNDNSNSWNAPEVESAKVNGDGYHARFANRWSEQEFHYAVKVESGEIVRITSTTDSIFIIMFRLIYPTLVLLTVILIVVLLLANRMTNSIVKPLNEIDLQNPDARGQYRELKPLLNRICDYNDEVNRNEKMRREFSANVSHELKTPLTSISGYAELLQSGMAKEQDVTLFSGKILAESKRMMSLVEDIMRLSNLDEKKVGIEKEKCRLLELAKPLQENLSDMAEKYKVDFTVEGEEVEAVAVPVMMEEVMYNLSTNAIKYNRPGGYAKLIIGQKNGHPMIQVTDNGIGIPEEHQGRIFERFYRVDKSHSKQTGGTGLGLAIVRHVVEYHDGDVMVASKAGAGTTFTIVLDAKNTENKADEE